MVRTCYLFKGLVALGICAILTGCGPDTPPTGKVSGTVTYNGAPVSNATVTFLPDNGRSASGVTDSSGNFTLSTFGTSDGALLGNHKVIVTPYETDIPMPETPGEAAAAPKAPFPEKYMKAETTDLTATVQSGANDVPLELKD